MAVKAIPDSYPRVMPYLSVDDAAGAITFYTAVFDAKERLRMGAPGGKVGHAELEVGDSIVMLADVFPDVGGKSPKDFGGSPVTMMVYVEDVDDVYKTALDNGASSTAEPSDQFYGDRTASFEDPFGHKWHIATHVEDVPEDEMQRRAMAAMGGGA